MTNITNKRLMELALAGLELERQKIESEISGLKHQLAGSAPAQTQAVGKRRGHLTAAGRKKLSDSMKRRWAERRAAAKVNKRKAA